MTNSDCKTQDTKDDVLFQRAIDILLSTEKKGYPSFVGGLKIASGNEYGLASPIDSSIIFGKFQIPEDGTVATAVKAAEKAFESWSSKTQVERSDIFREVLKKVKDQRYNLAACVMLSTGMVIKDCLIEADRLAEMIEEACRIEDGAESRGVWGVLSEHNSSLASPAGFASIAMITGNTVVSLPSMKCPMPMFVFNNILQAVGLPDGVFNITISNESKTDREMTDDPTVRGLIASGSGDRMEDLMFLPVDDELKFVNEIKGMNPIVVYKPGNIKIVADSIIESAFRSAGQRLHSCSKVIVTDSEREKLISALREAAKSITVGDPADCKVNSGPLMSVDDLVRFENYIEESYDNVIFGGKKIEGDGLENGSYVEPAIVVGMTDDCELGSYDTGLPILTIISVSNIEAAMEELVNTECGLSASIFSKDDKAIESFKEFAEAPCINVNNGTENMRPGSKNNIMRKFMR
ncbi:MAG TPA: aldehyde dehydrogenase family protein [Candidatus Methanomethylophilaceae archaeon]|nr:aldehyde dehydrogenase family protein [Candidatus Methanomethylophilaceae archaeon]